MFELRAHPKIVIDLENGLYQFAPVSGSGKSYMVSIIKRLASAGLEIGAYSYRDYVSGMKLEQVLTPGCRVAIIDEYGLYEGCGRETIRAFLDHGIVIIDHKNGLGCLDLPYRVVELSMEQDRLWVR